MEHERLLLSLFAIDSPSQRIIRLKTYIEDMGLLHEEFKNFYEFFSRQEEVKKNQGLAAVAAREKSKEKMGKKDTYDAPFFTQTYKGNSKVNRRCHSCNEDISGNVAFIWKINNITHYYHPFSACFPDLYYDKFDKNISYNKWMNNK